MPVTYRQITLAYVEPSDERIATRVYAAVRDAFDVVETAVKAIPGIDAEVVRVSAALHAPKGPRQKAREAAPAAATSSVMRPDDPVGTVVEALRLEDAPNAPELHPVGPRGGSTAAAEIEGLGVAVPTKQGRHRGAAE